MVKPVKVTFPTQDGVELVGLYRAAAAPRGAVLLVHMMPATKESWDAFAERIAERGWSSLAFDLRGHGESVVQESHRLDYRDFTDEEHRSSEADLEAAAAWLQSQTGLGLDRLRLAGASIGANLVLGFAARHRETSRTLALSPGLDYHGVTPEIGFPNLDASQRLWLVASEEDAYAYSSISELARIPTRAEVTVKQLHGAGHGTTIFGRAPAFLTEALDWLCAES